MNRLDKIAGRVAGADDIGFFNVKDKLTIGMSDRVMGKSADGMGYMPVGVYVVKGIAWPNRKVYLQYVDYRRPNVDWEVDMDDRGLQKIAKPVADTRKTISRLENGLDDLLNPMLPQLAKLVEQSVKEGLSYEHAVG